MDYKDASDLDLGKFSDPTRLRKVLTKYVLGSEFLIKSDVFLTEICIETLELLLTTRYLDYKDASEVFFI